MKSVRFSKLERQSPDIELQSAINTIYGDEDSDSIEILENKRNEISSAVVNNKSLLSENKLADDASSALWRKNRAPEIFALVTVFIVLIIVAIVVSISSRFHAHDTSASYSSPISWDSYQISALHEAVAADSSVCSDIGLKVLAKGGNAVDAAIASTFCLGVISPLSSGIGGGCFIVIHNSSTEINTFIDSREVAPAASSENMFKSNPLNAQNGGMAIAVLAEVKGLHLAWTRHGSGNLTWMDLVSPASVLAKEWTISVGVAALLLEVQDELRSGLYPALSELYLRNDGKTPKHVGDVVKQPLLSHTLEMIAKDGPGYLYETMAEQLSAEIIAAGGIMTAEDIRRYEPIVYPALEIDFMGLRYVGAGGSSSGGPVVAGMLLYMDAIATPLVSMGVEYYHYLVEAMKHCFAMRLYLTDPATLNSNDSIANSTDVVQALLNTKYMASLFYNGTKPDRVQPLNAYGGTYNLQHFTDLNDHGTSHISVLDSQGNAVSLTSTINTHFGSKVVSDSTGIVFNNEMDDFSIPGVANHYGLAPSHFNFPQPYKRPLSSMSPSIILNKRQQQQQPGSNKATTTKAVRLIGGASGGPKIITATAQVILNYLGKGMDLLSAVIAPRIHSQLLPDIVLLEDQSMPINQQQTTDNLLCITMPDSVYSALLTRGHHNITTFTGSMAVTQFIAVDPETHHIIAVSDPRKDGRPAGN